MVIGLEKDTSFRIVKTDMSDPQIERRGSYFTMDWQTMLTQPWMAQWGEDMSSGGTAPVPQL
jgi:hypothetical protein